MRTPSVGGGTRLCWSKGYVGSQSNGYMDNRFYEEIISLSLCIELEAVLYAPGGDWPLTLAAARVGRSVVRVAELKAGCVASSPQNVAARGVGR